MNTKILKISACIAGLALFLYITNQFETPITEPITKELKPVPIQLVDEPVKSFTSIIYQNCEDFSKNKIPSNCFLGETNQKLYQRGIYQSKNSSLSLKNRNLFLLPNHFFNETNSFCVKHLYLQENGFQAFPMTIHNLKELETLDISSNKIKYLEGFSFSQNKILKELNANNNEIRTINLSGFQALKNLSLTDNLINKIEPITKASNIQSIDLSNNQLTVFPYQLKDIKNLTRLDLSNNQLCFMKKNNNFFSLRELQLPASLEQLDLGNNRELKDIPLTFFDQLPNLKRLTLYPCAIPKDRIQIIRAYLEEKNSNIRLFL